MVIKRNNKITEKLDTCGVALVHDGQTLVITGTRDGTDVTVAVRVSDACAQELSDALDYRSRLRARGVA